MKLGIFSAFLLLMSCSDSVVLDSHDQRLSVQDGSFFFEGKLFTGKIHKMGPENRLFRETPYRSGRIEGDVLSWHSNGTLASKRPYRKGKKHGLHESWFPNGKKRSQSRFRDGKNVGQTIEWHKNGKIYKKIVFENGREVHSKIWRPSGQIYANIVRDGSRNWGMQGDRLCLSTEQ